MLTPDQAKTMLSLQHSMNTKVDPDWIQARYPYLRAVAVEGAEAIEHHGWKWWKKQELDLPQLQMELVDIWHFILSELLLRSHDNGVDPQQSLDNGLQASESISQVQFDGIDCRLAEMDLLSKLELLIGLSVARRIELAVFASIMADCQLDWTELFRQYVGKNVLNMFRQDKGYKSGIYRKVWNGREDNEYLVDIIHTLDAGSADFKQAIYAALDAAYAETGT